LVSPWTLGFPSSDHSEFGFIGVLFSLIYIRAKFYAREKFIPFPEKEIKTDEVVKSQQNDGFVKSSRCKARKN